MIRTNTMYALRLAPFAIVGLLAGCSPTVPYAPTWTNDVQPILLANCARCHSEPAIGGAPSYFRLDVYADTTNASGMKIMGAGSVAVTIKGDLKANTMPPRFKLSDRQKQIIDNWIAAGAPGPSGRPTGPDAGAAAAAPATSGSASAPQAPGTGPTLAEVPR